MEPACRTRARGQGRRGPGASALPLLLLLLLLSPPLPPRPAGCVAGAAPGTPSGPASDDPGVPCDPRATCPSGGPRLPRQVPTDPDPPQPSTSAASPASPASPTSPASPASPASRASPASPASPTSPARTVTVTEEVFPTCGSSQEQDPTLRDPESMARRWPWMVSVQANGTHICAGTLIASQWVLTVAHCLIQHDFTYSVRVGSPRIDEVSQTTSDIPVYQVILNKEYRSHQYWSWVGRANDIGLLKLAWAVTYNKYVWPICLPGLDFEVKDGSFCTVTGWGLPRVNGIWPQFQTIQEKGVTILNSKACDKIYHKISKVPKMVRIVDSKMVCAEDFDREQFCYEISGEPLACSVDTMWYLVGLVSWGPGCSKSEAPPIYLQVTSYQRWIWERVSGQDLPAPSRALLLVLSLPLGLLSAL